MSIDNKDGNESDSSSSDSLIGKSPMKKSALTNFYTDQVVLKDATTASKEATTPMLDEKKKKKPH